MSSRQGDRIFLKRFFSRQLENNHEALKSFLWKMDFRVLLDYSNALYDFFFLTPRTQIDLGLIFCQADTSQGRGCGVEIIARMGSQAF